MKLDLNQILDGYAGNEHALVASPLQEDVLGLLRTAHTSYTTTLNITNGGAEGQDWAIVAMPMTVAALRARRAYSQPVDRKMVAAIVRDQLFLHARWLPSANTASRRSPPTPPGSRPRAASSASAAMARRRDRLPLGNGTARSGRHGADGGPARATIGSPRPSAAKATRSIERLLRSSHISIDS